MFFEHVWKKFSLLKNIISVKQKKYKLIQRHYHWGNRICHVDAPTPEIPLPKWAEARKVNTDYIRRHNTTNNLWYTPHASTVSGIMDAEEFILFWSNT
jgi:hypothetical protein